MENAALAIMLCRMFALPASADTICGGKVTSVDPGGTGFTYSKKKKHWRFRITDKNCCPDQRCQMSPLLTDSRRHKR
jgi:hypothetical protein